MEAIAPVSVQECNDWLRQRGLCAVPLTSPPTFAIFDPNGPADTIKTALAQGWTIQQAIRNYQKKREMAGACFLSGDGVREPPGGELE
jgi:hypothetical protein